MDANTLLADEARRIQASGVLGEAKMRRLFDYLAQDCQHYSKRDADF